MSNHSDLIDLVFSWSLEHICNGSPNESQVERIPQSFQSVQHYLQSFVSPLLEEIREELSLSMKAISNAPFAEVISLIKSKPYETPMYNVTVDYWRNLSSHESKLPYRALPGDIFVFTEAKPETSDDLKRSGRTWTLGCMTKRTRDDESKGITATHFKVKVSNDLGVKDGIHKFFCVVFLTNIKTSKRIWSALHTLKNQEVMDNVLYTNTTVDETCNLCPEERNQIWQDKSCLSSKLNESQYEAVVSSICKIQCNHRSFVELIWGPPGTGKTRTLGMLLWALLGLECRTLTCAPTNIAITEVASRVVGMVRESFETSSGKDALFCPLGDILLFGNKDQLKVSSDVQDVYLDYRVEKLLECFGSQITSWKYCFTSMIDFLEGCVSQYQNFCDNQLSNEKCSNGSAERKVEQKSFLQFVRDRFGHVELQLRRCVSTICTHVPISCIQEHNFQRMVSLIALLDSFKTLLNHDNEVSEDLKEFFSKPELVDASQSYVDKSTVPFMRSECISALRNLQLSLDELKLPRGMNKDSLKEFCFQMASLILCTASSSHKLHSVSMKPLRLLVIDEAAQMKECESIIPLQLSGIRHAILIGDECQLPALVRSKVSKEADFGRSLFERLTLMGHSKHLLNIQYRMHPSICSFPNSKFYQSQIIDAPNVKSYRKCYLPGPIFGPFSFINISCGKEVRNAQGSWMNMVEVAIVLKILQMLHKACTTSKQKVSVGIVTPYSAQIAELQQKIGRKYDNQDSFTVKVKTIDGFQGGEEDVIIISTVRSDCTQKIEFISSPQRTNVALTRARHCLWILGNKGTLGRSKSVWEELICDAKARQCYFSADENKDIEKVLLEVKKELDQLDDLLNGDSMLFKNAKWKVLFSDNFRKSFAKLKSSEMKKSVLHLLSKLSTGWRPKWNHAGFNCESSSQILKKFYVMGLYIVCSNDIDMVKEAWCQILKVWDVLPIEEIPKLDRRLNGIFGTYTDDYLNRCKVKLINGAFEDPMTWESSYDIVKYKIFCDTKVGNATNVVAFEESYVENTKEGDSLSLMKFYSLSSGMVSHMISGCDGEEMGLPFELTTQQKEIILFNRSTFILGRSGTGKTSVLTTKLIQNEQLYHIASEGFHETKSNLSTDVSGRNGVSESGWETKGAVLHQIFVTVSPKLCYAVKQDVSQLKSFICRGQSSAESNSIRVDDIDDTTQFTNIPDSFVDLPPELYPLVITFHKFMIMLNGTVGTSYFERFPNVRKLCCGKTGNSRSVALQNFIRTKEVNYEKFVWSYWPHFNTHLTKKLDPSTVFTEIMSIIKGGLQAGEAHDGKLSRQDYVLLSDGRGSLIGEQKREIVYDIFLEYEKKKVVSGEFDLADLVVDLHCRLKNERYEGHLMDFVYIDEVQDLSMSQIALFKYICRNVDDGFVFSGDTAQTIARGIDFRFEDIRCLFYKEFVMGLKSDEIQGRKEKGHISDIFNLSENFRTHAGVLKLAQSVIDLVYHFFPFSIDFLRPETSIVNGKAPILLKSKNNDTAIMTIFGNSANNGGKVVGFGAEQVILVRDDCSRKEILDYVGKHALVLTIMECKGLEFQDVLLYNFFSSSPLRNQWRIIYGYMKEQDLLDSTLRTFFPSFNQEKHNVLCSELKQLYVAITRTRQRLWICENVEEFSEPMFDYWKKLHMVQEKELDDSLVREMQIESSQEEWKSRGIKFFHEHNYKNAITCFERAGDTHWESYAKASKLRADADQMRGQNTEMSDNKLRKAADIFDSIGKHELVAQCFFELNEYERAGKIYLEKCGESKLESAGECFSLAGCYKIAAEVYARANLYQKCLFACSDGKLFEMGLHYIESWKQYAAINVVKELGTTEKDFLQRAALHYYELKYFKSMLQFVRSFQSMDSIRVFLKNLNLLDELLLLEQERGNFVEAADIARLKKNSLLEVDLVEKAGLFREASMLILWYVFSNSLQSRKKDELLIRAKSIANNHSDQFHEFVCMEADILSRGKTNNKGELLEMGLQFIQYWKLHAPEDVGRVKKPYEMKVNEQNMLERCARHYYDMNNSQAMMKHVEAFHSIELIRNFLRSLNCLNELLLLEQERGNFVEAADIARLKKNSLLEVDLVEKAGLCREASMLILWYVFSNSLQSRKKDEFLTRAKKDELLIRAKSIANNHSDQFHEFVCMEAEILSRGKTNNKGELLEMGLQFIQYWKLHAPEDVGRVKKPCEMKVNEQNMLERCARHYYDMNNSQAMMKHVEAFHSIELIRDFLRSLNCLNELLLLEEKRGNFVEAANIAKLKKNSLLEVDLVEKAGLFREASMLILWYVFSNSLQSMKKDELLIRAKSIANNHSDQFHEFVCMEADILSRGKTNNKGELLEMGLQFIQYWKLHAPEDVRRVKKPYEMKVNEQNMLERCARHYHDLKDYQAMMKHVEAFHSIELIRDFLRSLNCLNELLLLEEKRGNFMEAANIAEQKGDLLRKADLLEKAGQYYEASNTVLWCVFARSLWVSQSKGWPLKQFREKEELLARAKSCARNHSVFFYEFVSREVNILSNRECTLSELREYLLSPHRNKSLRGEILSAWKILDAHLNSDTSKYEWGDEMVTDMTNHSEDMISQNRISAETLVCFWNVWKQMIVNLIEHYLQRIGRQDINEYSNYEEFCLNYMGVRKLVHNQRTIYLLLQPDADWIRGIDDRFRERNGNMVHIGARQFVFAALSYWSLEIFSVGVKVLRTLKALHDDTVKNFFSVFHQSVLVRIFEVSKFLKEYNFHHRENNKAFVQEYLTPFVQSFIGHVFPHDWRKSLTENMIVLRGTNQSMNLINEVILGNISSNGELMTYGQMGRVVMMILGSGKLNNESYEKVESCFFKNSRWMTFVKELIGNIVSDVALIEVSLVRKFHEALEDTYFANCTSEKDYVSPTCFLYLLERLLFMVSYFQGCYLFTSKASLIEWLIFQECFKNPNASLVDDIKSSSLNLGDIHNFIANLVQELLLSKSATMEWIISTEKSTLEDYYPLFVLRLIVLLCLVCVNSGKHFDKLFTLLNMSDISSQLPRAFCDAIYRRECYFVDALADALKKIGNPLVIVGVGNNFSKFSCSDAVFVNLKVEKCRDDILREVFADEGKTTLGEKDFIYPFSNCSYGLFWKIFDASNLENKKDGNVMSLMSAAPKIKVEVEKKFQLLSAEMESFRNNTSEDGENLLVEANTMLDDLKQLSFALDMSEHELEGKISTIIELLKRMQLRGPKLDHFLNNFKMINKRSSIASEAHDKGKISTIIELLYSYYNSEGKRGKEEK